MPRAFTDISFTDSVKAAQQHYGSRDASLRFERAEDPRNSLTPNEIDFIQHRDSFYQATVSDTGWPYLQHRGGAIGFLRVLGERRLGYADFRGNRQYLSVGNLTANQRIMLFLMDYANKRRLKIWGHAQVIDVAHQPELLAPFEVAGYSARIERLILIEIAAFDWNCSQHIEPRYTEAERARLLP